MARTIHQLLHGHLFLCFSDLVCDGRSDYHENGHLLDFGVWNRVYPSVLAVKKGGANL